ncbi:MAG: hypothetical protein HY296_01095 [Thaumarchaeota archaeon]|nr:hypothetical protein [Nitrososphaerota archaeon]
MPSLSFVGGVRPEYEVLEGKAVVRINSTGRLNHRSIQTGTAELLFHWVSNGKTSRWMFNPSIRNPTMAAFEESTGGPEGNVLSVTVGGLLPATGLLRERMVGLLVAPAVHVDVPFGEDLWVFIMRSPWFPLRVSPAKSTLLVTHGSDRATALLAPTAGELSASLSLTGGSFKRASLFITRRVGPFKSDELIGGALAGSQSMTWKPILRSFDLCLATHGSMRMSQLVEVARGLGASVSSGIFGASVPGDFILCDGPGLEYGLSLRGALGLLPDVSDQTSASISW